MLDNDGSMQEEGISIEPLSCAFCFKDLVFLTIPQREAHYEDHFSNDTVNNSEARSKSHTTFRNLELAHFPCVVDSNGTVASASSSKSTYNALSPKESKSPNKMWSFLKETDVFWYPEQTTAAPPSNYTPGMSFSEIEVLESKDIEDAGLIPLIRNGLVKGQCRQLIRRAV